MFVLEQFIKRQTSKRRAWEKRADKWVDKMTEEHGYGYTRGHYSRRIEPREFKTLGEIGMLILPYLIGSVLVGFFAWVIFFMPQPEPDPNNPHNCSVLVKKDDKVAVTYGPFVGSEGTVVEQDGNGCGVKMKLSKSTNTRDACVEKKRTDCREERNVGEELYVDSSKNITKI